MKTITVRDKTYKYVDFGLRHINWRGAHDLCSSINYELPVPLNEDEHNKLVSLSEGNHMFIGITDKFNEGNWVNYYTGEKINYTKWDPGQPDNYQREGYGPEHYGEINYDRVSDRWNDITDQQSDRSAKIICMKLGWLS